MFFVLAFLLLLSGHRLHGGVLDALRKPIERSSVFLQVTQDVIRIYVNLEDVLNNFQGAINQCERMGGFLPTIHDQETVNFLTDIVFAKKDDHREKQAWLNMKRVGSTCKWMDGSPNDFSLTWRDDYHKCSTIGSKGCDGSCCGVTLWVDDHLKKVSPYDCKKSARVACVVTATNDDFYDKLNVITQATSGFTLDQISQSLLRPEDERILLYRIILPTTFELEAKIEELEVAGIQPSSGKKVTPSTKVTPASKTKVVPSTTTTLTKNVRDLTTRVNNQDKKMNQSLVLLESQLMDVISDMKMNQQSTELKANIAIGFIIGIVGVTLLIMTFKCYRRHREQTRIIRSLRTPMIEVTTVADNGNIYNEPGVSIPPPNNLTMSIPKESNLLPSAKKF